MIKKFFLLFISSFLFFLFFLYRPRPVISPEINLRPEVKGEEFLTRMTAIVGGNSLALSGFTSPFASVKLTSSNGSLYRLTTADKNGIFSFFQVPVSGPVGEISLIAQDTDGMTSPPLFLPQPGTNTDVTIADVLMPPTIYLSSGSNLFNQTAYSSGKSFPNSKILVYLYAEPKNDFWSKTWNFIVKSVFAKTAPRLLVETDEKGDFEFSLPTIEPAEQKIFVAGLLRRAGLTERATIIEQATGAQGKEQDWLYQTEGEDYSPKSFTLSFKTLSFWQRLFAYLVSFLALLHYWLQTILNDPVKIIWLEIPLIIILFLTIIIRAIKERYLSPLNKQAGQEEDQNAYYIDSFGNRHEIEL